MVNGLPWKFVGGNQYSLIGGYWSQASLADFFAACRVIGVTVIRTWALDPYCGFRSLNYPTGGTNLLTNPDFEPDATGWTLTPDGAGNFALSVAEYHHGTHSLKLNGAWGTYAYATLPVPVAQHTDYVWTVWEKVQIVSGDGSHLPPELRIGTTPGAFDLAWGGFQQDTAGQWVRKQIAFNSGANTTIYVAMNNDGGNNIAYFDDMDLELATPPTLDWNESPFVQIDTVLEEARKAGIKLLFSLADNPTYNTKGTYLTWVNATKSKSLSDNLSFFTDPDCIQLHKDLVDKLTSRVNTINERVYANDDTIFGWELGNEMRTDHWDTGTNDISSSNLAALSNPGGWADIISTYIKSKDANHMVGYGDMGHSWHWVDKDAVCNGTYYGVSYEIMAALPNIDYVDFHLYPNEANGNGFGKNVGGGTIWGWGVFLGFPPISPNVYGAAGLFAQIKDYIAKAKANNKPCVCTELGYNKDYIAGPSGDGLLVQNPVQTAMMTIINTLFENGGDGVLLWSISQGANSGFELELEDFNVNQNYNNEPLRIFLAMYAAQFQSLTPVIPPPGTLGNLGWTKVPKPV